MIFASDNRGVTCAPSCATIGAYRSASDQQLRATSGARDNNSSVSARTPAASHGEIVRTAARPGVDQRASPVRPATPDAAPLPAAIDMHRRVMRGQHLRAMKRAPRLARPATTARFLARKKRQRPPSLRGQRA
ncbi:hypothetical protein F511_29681 [Dorcoceras hygrometricum]|uniref:Uncharacterized protein n=1 Tax=Dorcoceras hygrometricum TaxID=472368 RepID=A0A2Z7B161_9LAMI|nr:hypothetical protein F511_29681 [Dorcoceras hygrometricum]